MRERSHESSPALGGVIIGLAMTWSLAYAFGYGNQVADLAGGALGHLLDIAAQAVSGMADTIRSWT